MAAGSLVLPRGILSRPPSQSRSSPPDALPDKVPPSSSSSSASSSSSIPSRPAPLAQLTGLRAAKQALALFNFHQQQQEHQQQDRAFSLVHWHNVDACDVPAGEVQRRTDLNQIPVLFAQNVP